MKAVVGAETTTIEISLDEAKEHCKIGQGAECCIWLVSGAGFECLYFNKPFSLVDRWQKGLTTAKRDGCRKVKAFDRFNEGPEVLF